MGAYPEYRFLVVRWIIGDIIQGVIEKEATCEGRMQYRARAIAGYHGRYMYLSTGTSLPAGAEVTARPECLTTYISVYMFLKCSAVRVRPLFSLSDRAILSL